MYVGKGKISAVSGETRATIVPLFSAAPVSAQLTVPFFLAGSLAVGMEVVYAQFPDNTGVILARMDGQDVTGGATWYEKAMTWAKSNGVSDGTMPEKNITREQLATMLYSYAKLKGIDTTQGGMAVREFNDYDSISSWAGQSMTWAVNAGILSGRGNNTLAPTAGATRAEMAVMLQQFVGLMEK